MGKSIINGATPSVSNNWDQYHNKVCKTKVIQEESSFSKTNELFQQLLHLWVRTVWVRALPVGEDGVGEGSLPLQRDDYYRVDGACDQDVLGNRGQFLNNCFGNCPGFATVHLIYKIENYLLPPLPPTSLFKQIFITYLLASQLAGQYNYWP